MQTLLNKVRDAEAAAHAQITTAQRAAKDTLARLLADEERVLTDIKQRAEQRAEAIVAERLSAAQAEVNQLRQQETGAVNEVHAAAERNRADALAFAWQRFQEAYLKDEAAG